MPYSDPDKQREANRRNQQRYRKRQKQQRNNRVFDFDSPDQFARVILGLEHTRVTQREIRKARSRLARTLHPDINPGPEALRLMQLVDTSADQLERYAPKV